MFNLKLYISLLATFAFLSIQAVGGGAAVLPEMERTLHGTFGLNDAEFVQAYGLGQLVPGPNMLMVIVLGYRIGGTIGALIAFVAFFLPVSLIVFFVTRYLRHLAASPWKSAVRDGLAPVTIGLMAAGVYAMGKAATTTWLTIAIAAAIFALMVRTKINPVLLVLACAIFGAFLLPRV
ncbi:MAG: chromate transporter [Candidatus Baltobacteraceae bacterium]